MADLAPYGYFLRDVFPRASPELLRLFEGAAENASLLRSDYLTIRDWLDIARCGDVESLHALVLVMLLALEEGSLCVELSATSLTRRLDDLVDATEAQAWATRILG